MEYAVAMAEGETVTPDLIAKSMSEEGSIPPFDMQETTSRKTISPSYSNSTTAM
jgi:hypothetical protein